MVLSLVLLGVLSIGLAFHWHQRISGFNALLMTIKSRFDFIMDDGSDRRAYASCISHRWMLEYVARGRESRFGESIRNLLNTRTILGVLVVSVLIWPIIGTIAYLVYRSFAFFGVSIVVIIIAVFLIRTSDDVKASYGLLSWLRSQDDSEITENDGVYVEICLKIISKWRTILLIVAVVSLVAAPWGELIPEAVALGSTGLFVVVFTLGYQAVATYSQRIAVIVTLFLLPASIALVYILSGSISRRSMSIIEKVHEIKSV